MSRPRNAGLAAGECSIAVAASRLRVGAAAVLSLIRSGKVRGGRRAVPRRSPLRPWSRRRTHTRYWVDAASLDAFEAQHPGELQDLRDRYIRRAVAARANPAEVAA